MLLDKRPSLPKQYTGWRSTTIVAAARANRHLARAASEHQCRPFGIESRLAGLNPRPLGSERDLRLL